MKSFPQIRRQGDVLLTPVSSLPAGCTEVPHDKGRIVLAYGEVTGHAHAIADYHAAHENATAVCDATYDNASLSARDAAYGADMAITRAMVKARLLIAPSGERFLEVTEPVTLRHEEHDPHVIEPGIYRLPQQMEYSPAELQRVAD